MRLKYILLFIVIVTFVTSNVTADWTGDFVWDYNLTQDTVQLWGNMTNGPQGSAYSYHLYLNGTKIDYGYVGHNVSNLSPTSVVEYVPAGCGAINPYDVTSYQWDNDSSTYWDNNCGDFSTFNTTFNYGYFFNWTYTAMIWDIAPPSYTDFNYDVDDAAYAPWSGSATGRNCTVGSAGITLDLWWQGNGDWYLRCENASDPVDEITLARWVQNLDLVGEIKISGIAGYSGNMSIINHSFAGVGNYTAMVQAWNGTHWSPEYWFGNYTPSLNATIYFNEHVNVSASDGNAVMLWSNVTNVSFNILNFSKTYVSVEYDDDILDDFSSKFVFYNYQNASMNVTVWNVDPDLVQTIRASSEARYIEDVIVCAWTKGTWNGVNGWWRSYCDLTDTQGQSKMQLLDENDYKFTMEKDGFVTLESVIIRISAENLDPLEWEIEPVTGYAEVIMMLSSCRSQIFTPTNCTVYGFTDHRLRNVCLNWSHNNTIGGYCMDYNYTTGVIRQLNSTHSWWAVNLSLDGLFIDSRNITYINLTQSVQINKSTLTDGLEEDYQSMVLLHFILFAVAIIVGIKADKLFKGYGSIAFSLSCLIIAVILEFPLFYVGFVPTMLYFIFKQLSPVMQ